MALSKVDLANQVENQLPQSLVADNVNFRNIIINGDMSIAQRGTSATSIDSTNDGYLTVDRWIHIQQSDAPSNTGKTTMSQSTDVPSGQGFAKSIKIDVTTAQTSITGTNARVVIVQRFEGQNLQYLKKGTSSAESLTCSFWVKSNKTGTYICALRDKDNSRDISKSYTISSADTWEKKTITYEGDTTGAFDNDNARSLDVIWGLATGSDYGGGTLQTTWGTANNANVLVGQVNLMDSTSNEFYITGVQLEAGTSASDFEFLPVDVNLQRCLRYYELLGSGDNYPLFNAFNYNSTILYSVASTQVVMRTNPSVDQTTGTSYYKFIRDNSNDFFDSISVDIPKTNSIELFNDSEISGTAGQAGWVRLNNASSYLALDAEL
jgi:hypothetical protein